MSESNNRNSSGANSSHSNVRHIPIHVEGRDIPLLNTIPTSKSKDSFEFYDDIGGMGRPFGAGGAGASKSGQFPTNNHNNSNTTTSSNSTSSSSNGSKNSKSNLYHNFDTVDGGGATIPSNSNSYSNVSTTPLQGSGSSSSNQSSHQQEEEQNEPNNLPLDGEPPIKSETTIEKIQSIQKDVLNLMDRVEHYKCQTKRDKEYVYLDEMLTQHLLKLDTIDADGNEIIKKARREAIKCINKCIEALEAKADAAPAKMDTKMGPNTNITNIDNAITSQTAIT